MSSAYRLARSTKDALAISELLAKCGANLVSLSERIDTTTAAGTEKDSKAFAPAPPLAPGWLVVYRDRQWVLCGGCDDRQHGTVQECRWSGTAWTVHLTDGQQLPLISIRSVGKADSEGTLVAAWSIREHGYDGIR